MHLSFASRPSNRKTNTYKQEAAGIRTAIGDLIVCSGVLRAERKYEFLQLLDGDRSGTT